jgi:hypothetical protein
MVTLEFESAELPDADDFHLSLPSSYLILHFSQSVNDICLPISTPPPRSSAEA